MIKTIQRCLLLFWGFPDSEWAFLSHSCSRLKPWLQQSFPLFSLVAGQSWQTKVVSHLLHHFAQAGDSGTTLPALVSDPWCCAKQGSCHSHRCPAWSCTSQAWQGPAPPSQNWFNGKCPTFQASHEEAFPARSQWSQHLLLNKRSCSQFHIPPAWSLPFPVDACFRSWVSSHSLDWAGRRKGSGWWSKSASLAKATDTEPGTGVWCVWLLDKAQETEGLSHV